MGTPENKLSDIVGIVRSWIPRRSEPENVSRDFWMPDQSCRVCYECDSQFTVFNRRHHCRLCGRVFCSKCTTNSIPAQLNEPGSPGNGREECERVRVCSYCFSQWDREAEMIDNGRAAPSNANGLSPSPSATSLVSSKSSCTGQSSSSTFGSAHYSTSSYQHVPSTTNFSPRRSVQTDYVTVLEGSLASQKSLNLSATVGDPSQQEYSFCGDRSDDEDEDDDDDDDYHSDSEIRQSPQANDYYGRLGIDEIGESYGSHKDNEDLRSLGDSPLSEVCNAESTETNIFKEEAAKTDAFDQHHIPPYEVDNKITEPVDFENNGLLWIPPEPEEEEEEREGNLFDEEEEGESSTGEWGYVRSSDNFGSGEHQSKEKPIDEHKNAMKNVVDGHFKALIAQLLHVENLPVSDDNNDKESWLEIVTSLSWEAATLLKPDTSRGGGMDPGGYVKVKCIACGRRNQSSVVKGVVCKKNVAHRRMASRRDKPRFLILGGALEYQRVSNLLSSFHTLLQQEMDHLKMAVAKIEAHQPDVLLVEKSVSRYAQDYLLAKNISLVLNVKRPLLERIARCTGAQIISSIDHLVSPKLGYCDIFHVEKYVEEHGSKGQDGKKLTKTLMFFEGCPKPLGCTILLKGASGEELKKVKHVVQYGVFAAYHLALETSFLADEGASLPELPLKSPITVALPDKPSGTDRSISTVPGYNVPRIVDETKKSSKGNPLEKALSSTNPFSKMKEDYSLVSLSGPGQENDISVGDTHDFGSEKPFQDQISLTDEPLLDSGSFGSLKRFEKGDSNDDFENRVVLNRPATLDMESIKKTATDCNEVEPLKEEFPPSPSNHQSILVSLSTRCVWKGTVCERSHLFRIKYYGNFDKPLGRFLRDHLFDQSYRCASCGMPSEAHIYGYTHRQGSLTISVKKLSEFLLSGEKEGKIWMWHRCLKCPRTTGFPPATRRVVMSDAAWGLSFGKFLELSFSNHLAASRVASCGHSLHRDCLRFYGFGRMVACFRYSSINVLSVHLPPPKLDFYNADQEWLQEEANKVQSQAVLLFTEVQNALQQISQKKVSLEQQDALESRQQLAELEGMLEKDRKELEESLQRELSREEKAGSPSIDILEINKLRRQIVFRSYIWDQLLIHALSSDNYPIPKLKEKSVSSAEKIIETNEELGPDTNSRNTDSLDLGENNKNVAEVLLSSGESINGKCDSRENGEMIRRAYSEGEYPKVADLSDTLDAAWTGDSTALNSATEKSKPESSTSDQSQIDKFPSLGSTLSGESSKNLVGMPFLNLNGSMNKNLSFGAQKLLNGDYNPTYLSTFWEIERRSGARFLLPIGVNDIFVPVYEDEPTSIIAYTLVSHAYNLQISESEKPKDTIDSSVSLPLFDSLNLLSLNSFDESVSDIYRSFGPSDESISSSTSNTGSRSSQNVDPLLYSRDLHARISFTDDGPFGKVKYTVTCYYAKRFDALRRICCPSEIDYVRSLSRCKKWGAQGGKSNVFFAKTLDERFIIKQVTKTELESFIKFGPAYFKYLSESISTGSPTCLAKILGIYQVSSKNFKGGKETKMDVLVMENLLFRRNITRLYDLKGSARSRYNSDTSGTNKVLLDQNLIEAMPTSPIFLGNKAKRSLERAVWNDTSFLALIDVMDYSLLVGVDEENHELVLGIIDFMRQYTWDKHLETWVKTSGFLGGPRNEAPTVISPQQYKKRFRKAMSTYFLMVPDQWFPAAIIPYRSQSDLGEEDPEVASLIEKCESSGF